MHEHWTYNLAGKKKSGLQLFDMVSWYLGDALAYGGEGFGARATALLGRGLDRVTERVDESDGSKGVFPLAVAETGVQIYITSAQSSKEDDRTKMRNQIGDNAAHCNLS